MSSDHPPYEVASYFETYSGRVAGAGAVLEYRYVEEIGTLGMRFLTYPKRAALPATLVSDDNRLNVVMRTDTAGASHLSALYEVPHAICNNKRAHIDGKWCENNNIGWSCYCTYFRGVSSCYSDPCGGNGNGGGVEVGAVDFSAIVPGGEW